MSRNEPTVLSLLVITFIACVFCSFKLYINSAISFRKLYSPYEEKVAVFPL